MAEGQPVVIRRYQLLGELRRRGLIGWSSWGLIRRCRGLIGGGLIGWSRFFIRDSWSSIRVDWWLIWHTVVILRGNIGGIRRISKLISASGSEKKVSQNGSFQKGDLAKEQPINEGATGDSRNGNSSQVEKSFWVSFWDRSTNA